MSYIIFGLFIYQLNNLWRRVNVDEGRVLSLLKPVLFGIFVVVSLYHVEGVGVATLIGFIVGTLVYHEPVY